MGQLVISLLAAAYYLVGPLVLLVGTAALGTLAILAAIFSVTAQVSTGLVAGRATGSTRFAARALGWAGVTVGSAVGWLSGVAAIVLGAGFLAATLVPYPALPV